MSATDELSLFSCDELRKMLDRERDVLKVIHKQISGLAEHEVPGTKAIHMEELRNKIKIYEEEIVRRGCLTGTGEAEASIVAHTGEMVSIFISYSHEDSAIAEAVKNDLKAKGIDVKIDKEVMEAGEDISSFIVESVHNTDATIFIVSSKSMASAWVAKELSNVLYNERFEGVRKLIPCYADEAFFEPSFYNDVADKFDQKIHNLNKEVDEAKHKKRPYKSLANKVSRLQEALTGLDKILERLDKTKCLDVHGNGFSDKLLIAIKSAKSASEN